MENNCNVIRDLLPLYADDMASADTKALVEEHLKNCDACKTELENYRNCPMLAETNENELQSLKSVGIKIQKSKKKAVIKAVSICLAVCLFFGAVISCEVIRQYFKDYYWNHDYFSQSIGEDHPNFTYQALKNGTIELCDCKLNLPKDCENLKYDIDRGTGDENGLFEKLILTQDGKEKQIFISQHAADDKNTAEVFGSDLWSNMIIKLVDKGARLSGYKGAFDSEFRYYLYRGIAPENVGVFGSIHNKLKEFAFYAGSYYIVPLLHSGFKLAFETDEGIVFGGVMKRMDDYGTETTYSIILEMPLKDGKYTYVYFKNFSFSQVEEVMSSFVY